MPNSQLLVEVLMKYPLPFRQVHLDFHTSKYIENIGVDFDPDEFADTLVRSKVNSINLFARGHHGWVYYETKKFPERRHPHLARNLLLEQIETCHKRGIRTPVYVTVQWDHFTALRHPEWRVMSSDGSLEGQPPYEDGFYRRLCLNTPYVTWLKEFVAEVLDELPADGLWLDIVDAQDCSCWFCRQGMRKKGLEPSRLHDRITFGTQVLHNFMSEMTAFMHNIDPELLIFYNAGHVGPRHRPMVQWFTHFELESLPSGGWGYLHFPIAARYARTLGQDYLGMTGKFLTSWGDFHSFKNQAALEFECFHMLALNAKCCIGDQLLPHGRLCQDTYDLIGQVYAQVAEKEPWCEDAKQVTEIAVMTPEAFDTALRREDTDFKPIQGAVRMLQETAQQFDIVDQLADFTGYRVLILPDKIPINTELTAKLQAFVNGGGRILASFASGMNAEESRIRLPGLDIEIYAPGPYDKKGNLVRGREYPRNEYIEYIRPRDGFAEEIPHTEHAMYMRGVAIEVEGDTEVLADTVSSYFDRDYKRFCSHRQTPSSGQVVHPAVIQKGNIIYFSHPIFSQYQTKAPKWVKQLFASAVDRLLPDPLVRVQAPTSLLVMVNKQSHLQRYVVHLLFYIPERRCEAYDVVEDVVPLHDVPVSIKLPEDVTSVRIVPDGRPLSYEKQQGRLAFVVPHMRGHCMVELSYR
jgi:hypothetical protein